MTKYFTMRVTSICRQCRGRLAFSTDDAVVNYVSHEGSARQSVSIGNGLPGTGLSKERRAESTL